MTHMTFRDLTRWSAAVLLFAPVAACNVLSDALDVQAPDRIERDPLEASPQNATLLLNGAIGDFECALGAFIVAGGLMGGELIETTATSSRWSYDRRDINTNETHYSTFSCQAVGVYTPIQTARWTADNVLGLLQGWSDAEVEDRQEKIAMAAAYAGYSRILLGEAFCSAAIDVGPEIDSQAIFAQAVEKFDLAITAATAASNTDLLNFAKVGRARALLNQGQFAEAAAAVTGVPDAFVWNATASEADSRRYNRVYSQNYGRAVSIAEPYRNLGDPRVAVVDSMIFAGDDRTPLFVTAKYTDFADPIPIASGDEARLIVAEFALEDGRRGDAVAIFQALRAEEGAPQLTAGELADLTDTELLAQERSRELFLEGQHLYDVRRLALPLFPAPGTTYSTVYAKGGDYGSQTCMPLPDVERFNNPNIGE